MNDPFAIQQASVGAAREGMDAPDLQVRIAQLKAQQGQALSPEELRRLGTRMGLETEAARQDVSRGLSGDQTIFGPRSTSVYQGLAGSQLDPTLAGARVEAARMASDPTYRALAEDQAALTRAGFGALRAGTGPASDLLANEQVAIRTSMATGIPIEEARAGQAVYRPSAPVETSVFAPAPAPEAPAAPKVKTTPQTRVSAKMSTKVVPTVDIKQFPSFVKNESDREIAALGRGVSTITAGQMRAKTAAALAPVETEVSDVDDLTGHTYVSKVLKNSRGDVFSVGEPVLAKANPITEAADKAFTTDYNTWATAGATTGAADAKMLRLIAKELPNMTMVSGMLPGFITKLGIQDYVLPPKSVDAADTIKGIAQRGARAILGAAYTQKEGEDFMGRAFKVTMDPKINAERANRMAESIEKAAAAKQARANYFDTHGTLSGYQGPDIDSNGVAFWTQVEKDVLGTAASGAKDDPASVRAAAKAEYLKGK